MNTETRRERGRQLRQQTWDRPSAAGLGAVLEPAEAEHALRVRVVAPPRRRFSDRQRPQRRRVVGVLRFVLFLLLVFLAAWAGVRVAQAGAGAAVSQPDAYVAEAGDTLWDIAASHYGDDVDPRRAVFEIRRVNGLLPHDLLQPGDTLILPVSDGWDRQSP